MEPFKTIIFGSVCLISIFLAWRCIVLTRAIARCYSVLLQLVQDSLTKDNIKVIAAAMYGMNVEEFERRMKK